jgi:transcriptional regulator with XRE-family HTH domain
MKLLTWMKRNKITQEQLAKKLGIKQQSVSRYVNGNPPKRKLAYKIVSITNGDISLKDLW